MLKVHTHTHTHTNARTHTHTHKRIHTHTRTKKDILVNYSPGVLGFHQTQIWNPDLKETVSRIIIYGNFSQRVIIYEMVTKRP